MRYRSIFIPLVCFVALLVISGCSDNDSVITDSNSPPAVPSDPFPPDGSENIDASISLIWSCSDPDMDNLSFDVYFGSQSWPELVQSDLARNEQRIENLNFSTTYYWRVVARSADGSVTEGPTWSFMTACSGYAYFPDPNLDACVRDWFDLPEGDICIDDLSAADGFYGSVAGIGNLTGLECMTQLTRLTLQNNSIQQIEPLSEMAQLEEVRLCNNEISDLSPISRAQNLRILWAYGNCLRDISPLSELLELDTLWLGANLISDLSPIANLVQLSELKLPTNHIDDVSSLEKLVNLEHLDLSFNYLSDEDLVVIGGMTSLATLRLRWNEISDISALSALTSLATLGLGNNDISDISALSALTGLRYLAVSQNAISDLSALSEMAMLDTLICAHSPLVDLTPLENLGELDYVSLSETHVSDVSPLVRNSGITDGDYVDLRFCPLSEYSISDLIPQLVARGVEVLY